MHDTRPELPPALPLVIDLDGTLTTSDTLLESTLKLIGQAPWLALRTLLDLRHGRAAFKAALAPLATIDVASLPFREELVEWIRQERARGRPTHLVTAAHQSIADRVADHLGIFDSAQGSDARRNLKGSVKAEYLAARFPEGFAYAGDSRHDFAVWRRSAAAILVDSASAHAAALHASAIPVARVFPGQAPRFQELLRLLRPHQWSKNALIFVPLLLSHTIGNLQAVLDVALCFVLFCIAVSATYIFNDLLDIEADRRHATKRLRPIAAGKISVPFATAIAVVMLSSAMMASAIFLPSAFLPLAIYVLVTILYSSLFKRWPFVDLCTLGFLYTLRILAGTLVADVHLSPWLLSFSYLFFFSLAGAKRLADCHNDSTIDQVALLRRGYEAIDIPLLLALGIASALASIVIVVLYIRLEAAQSGLYAQPLYLLATPMIILGWVIRIWTLANRGRLVSDPVLFALKDPISWGLLALICGFAGLAT